MGHKDRDPKPSEIDGPLPMTYGKIPPFNPDAPMLLRVDIFPTESRRKTKTKGDSDEEQSAESPEFIVPKPGEEVLLLQNGETRLISISEAKEIVKNR